VIEIISFTQSLIRCASVTPESAGVMDLLERTLSALGFRVLRQTFQAEGTTAVENLYARYGTESPNFCFAGHTDVVPVGDASGWAHPPFAAEIHDGYLYGRGAEDMKGAIAAFIAATARYLKVEQPKGSISLLITQDEEGIAINGTKPMLAWLAEKGEMLDACLVGEPTNPERIGDMVKIGRRGSISFILSIEGKQGHVAYPERADNPTTALLHILHALKTHALDSGTPDFPPSNLEITSIDVGNPTVNIIPARASAHLNIRFNTHHTRASLEAWVRALCERFAPGRHRIEVRFTGDAFLKPDAALKETLVSAIEKITGRTPVLSTTGGTSDARFIKDYCPVIEFGTTGLTPHMVNERVEITALEQLAGIYEEVLRGYFTR
jgi:succinyl-diaminopimelate desuccinylase